MKPDEPIYQVVQVPLLMQNNITLFHHDDYHKDNVELSTFTPQDDILIKLSDRLLLFDKHGNLLKSRLDETLARDPAFFIQFRLSQVQIVSPSSSSASPHSLLSQPGEFFFPGQQPESLGSEPFLALLFEKTDSLEAVVLAVRKTPEATDCKYTVAVFAQRHRLLPRELNLDLSTIRFRMTRLEQDGSLYTLAVLRERQVEGNAAARDSLIFVKDGEKVEHSEKEMDRIFRKKSKIQVIKKVA